MARTRKKKTETAPETTESLPTPTVSSEVDPDTLRYLCSTTVLEDLSSLNPDPANARLHNERNLAVIMESLRQFGQDQPLVVQREGRIVRKGNGRAEAMRRLGWTKAVVVWVDEDNWRAVARAIADNRASDLAEWNPSVLTEMLSGLDAEGTDVGSLGWTTDEVEKMAKLGSGPDSPEAPGEFPKVDEGIETEFQCPKCSYRWSGGSKK